MKAGYEIIHNAEYDALGGELDTEIVNNYPGTNTVHTSYSHSVIDAGEYYATPVEYTVAIF